MQYLLQIRSPQGILHVNATHTVQYQNEEISLATVSVRLQDQTFSGQGETTEIALLHLAKSLPDGYTVHSCLSCRHGNFCPVGNCDNEVFCTVDHTPTQKSDLYCITENAEERANRSRSLFHCCEKYVPQSDDCYTYSDYPKTINEK